MKRLVTLLPSVDVDLGRWLMQLWQIDYIEEPHAPVFHIYELKRLGLGPVDYPTLIDGNLKTAAVERLVLAYDHKAPFQVMPDKDEEPRLYQEIFELQNDARYTMGNGVVKWAYFEFMKEKKLVWKSFTSGVPWYEWLGVCLGYGWIKRKMVEGLELSEEAAAKGLADGRAGFDKVDAMLADGREYLAGGRLTLADLAFATSGAPLVLPRGYAGHLPEFEQLPGYLKEIVTEFRERPAGKFIHRIYDEHRNV
ncbi:glutathione S-transferase family protein [Rhodobacteraceae bacterium NNCM2]|nr:glutathione S-transferase family protein [Coraliihabitans acroporae]